MRIVLLLIVAAAIGVAATQLLKTRVPVAAPHQPAAVPTSREALQKFGQDVQNLTIDAAAEHARRAEEAAR